MILTLSSKTGRKLKVTKAEKDRIANAEAVLSDLVMAVETKNEAEYVKHIRECLSHVAAYMATGEPLISRAPDEETEQPGT